jgi:hypothetical protein
MRKEGSAEIVSVCVCVCVVARVRRDGSHLLTRLLTPPFTHSPTYKTSTTDSPYIYAASNRSSAVFASSWHLGDRC